MPLYDVAGALRGPVMNPEAKRRNQLKKLIAQFQVNPWEVSDDPRSYYKQLKALATQEGIPMSLPKALEKNPWGVGAYEAADTALFGLLPNQEYLTESEKRAAGIGGAVGMVGSIPVGGAAFRAGQKVLPWMFKGAGKMLPKFGKGADTAEDIAKKARDLPVKGAGIKAAADKFKQEATEAGFDIANFGKTANAQERAFFEKFMDENVTTNNKASFRNKFLAFLKQDKDVGYTGGGKAGFSKWAAETAKKGGKANKGSYVPYDEAPKGFKTGLKGFQPGSGQGDRDMIAWALKNGPADLRKKLAAAQANGERSVVENIIANLYKYRIFVKSKQSTPTKAWNAVPVDHQNKFKQVIGDMTDEIMSGNISLLDIASSPAGMNPLTRAFNAMNMGPEVPRSPGMPVGNIMPPAI